LIIASLALDRVDDGQRLVCGSRSDDHATTSSSELACSHHSDSTVAAGDDEVLAG
jgi:hypothetical protein